MITALALAITCSWNHPGADPTTSSVPATLHAMGIDSPELAAKIERGEYTELVTIHKNDRRMRGMTSGNARWCDGEVDTSRWSDEHAEIGRVYRVGDIAVVWYWRCKNMSFWTEPEPVAADRAFEDAAQAAVVPAEPLPTDATGAGQRAAEPEGSAIASGYGFAGPAGFALLGGGFAGAGLAPTPCPCEPCPVAAVPEPSEWLLLLAGLLVVVLVAIRKSRR